MICWRKSRSGCPSHYIEARIVNRRDSLTLVALVVAVSGIFGCARQLRGAIARDPQVTSDPCTQKQPGDFCVAELPTVPPVVAGEGRIWGLFARRDNFEIREYSTKSESVLARGTCPANTMAAALGAVDQQPAVLCADFAQALVVFGRKLPNSLDFAWQAPEALAHHPEESIKGISHFALLERRLSVVYRTEARAFVSGQPTTEWRLQISNATTQVTRQMQASKPVVAGASEILCPRAGVSRCDQPPVAAYVADGQIHVVLAAGANADRYLHLQQSPGKPAKVVPVADVMMAGKTLTSPCVSKSTNGNLRVYVPSRNIVGALLSDSGERVGVIEHGSASIAQGPDVYSAEDTRCPPELSALAVFPNGSKGSNDAKPRWLRATLADDTWIVGYGLPQFAVKQGDVTYSYKESFWVVRR